MDRLSNQIPYSSIEKLFAYMTMTYGNLMNHMWQGLDKNQVMVHWHMALDDYTIAEFERGVKALDKIDRPPTLPVFKKLCRPEVNAIAAYYEAVKGLQERRLGRKGEWSHPAIFWAAAQMAFDLLNQTQTQVEKRWKEILSIQYAKTTWQPVPDVPAPLPPLTVDKEGQAKVKQKVNEFLLKRDDRGNTDWIEYNLERLKNGWKPTQAVRMMVLNTARMKGISIPHGVN